jgi:outer membrane protein W
MDKSNLVGIIALYMMIVFILPSGGNADTIKPGYLQKNFVGARLGAWSNLGDKDPVSDENYAAEFSGTSIYGEFFYAHRIAPALAFEFALGMYSRGDIEYINQGNTYLGAVSLYPIIVTAKFFPLASVKSLNFYPYIQAGGGVYYGKRDEIDIYYTFYDDDIWRQETETKISYTFGGGIDFAIASQIGITINARYTPIEFGSALAGYEDYSNWDITIGAGYLFKK